MSAWQIRAGAQAPNSFAPSANCVSVPLAWCTWAKLPQAKLVRPDVHQVTFSTVETGLADYAISSRTLVFTGGPLVGGAARPVLDFAPEWSDSPDQSVTIRIARKKLGNARGQAEEYYQHLPLQQRQAGFVLSTAAEAARLVEFFRQAGGMARPWWSGKHDAHTYLVAAATGLELEVESAARLDGCEAVHIVSTGGDVAVRSVASIDGNTITLTAAVDMPEGSLVSPATLCRFASDKLRLSFQSAAIAQASVDTITLPTEAADVVGYDGTSAALLVVTDGTNTWRWTDHDRAVDAGTLGVFDPRHFELGEFTEELNLEVHEGSLEIRPWAGCPLLRLIEESESYDVWITAYECDPDVANSAEWLFTGRATKPQATGAFLSVSLGGFEGILDTKGPRQLMQDTCCAAYGDAKCAFVEAELGVEAVSSTGAQLDLVAPDPAPDLSRYAFGFAERTLGPGRVQRWSIRSAEIVDTVLRLQLDGTIYPAATAGQNWDLHTGCPGTWAACQERGNTINYRAFPHVPTRNPSIVPVTTTTGGKK
jgi:hypothetical protein